MTLSLAFLTGTSCVVATDRRVSGGLSHDEFDKSIALFAGDGIAAVSFAGLAQVGSFRTHDWLASTLKDRGGPTGGLHLIIRQTAFELTRRFSNNNTIAKVDHRLSILFAGYRFGVNEYFPFWALVTNYQHPDNGVPSNGFRVYIQELPPTGSHLSCAIGDYSAISKPMFSKIEKRCVGKTTSQVENILVGSIRKAAANSTTIGRQAMTLSLGPADTGTIAAKYHSATAKPKLALASAVWAQPETRISRTRGSITAVDDPNHQFVFPTQSRNDRCLCGSGKKYKYCHGKS